MGVIEEEECLFFMSILPSPPVQFGAPEYIHIDKLVLRLTKITITCNLSEPYTECRHSSTFKMPRVY